MERVLALFIIVGFPWIGCIVAVVVGKMIVAVGFAFIALMLTFSVEIK